MTYKVDAKPNNIPPKQQSEIRDVLLSLDEGQSFVVPNSSVRKTVLNSAKRLGIKVTSRKVDGKGFRIWRTQ